MALSLHSLSGCGKMRPVLVNFFERMTYTSNNWEHDFVLMEEELVIHLKP